MSIGQQMYGMGGTSTAECLATKLVRKCSESVGLKNGIES